MLVKWFTPVFTGASGFPMALSDVPRVKIMVPLADESGPAAQNVRVDAKGTAATR